MKAAALVVKTVIDNSELKKGLKENEELLKKQATYEEKIAYWQKDKEKHERLLKENQDKETDTYIQTRKENIAYAEENIKFYEKQIEKLKELNKEQQKNNSLQSVSNLSAKTSDVSDLLDTKTIEDDSVGNKVKKANVLGTALKKALTFGKGLGKALASVLATIAKITTAIVGIGVLLGGLSVGVAILGVGFKKAFENEQIKANLDYIRFAISQAIVPLAEKLANVILKIIDLLVRVLQYIRYIIHAWTGYDIFANAGVDAYAKSLKKASNNMKELNKQQASFDEMNVLSDNKGGATDTGGGVGPSFDLSSMEDMQIPAWIKWIAENKDLVITSLLAIGAAFLVLQLGLGGWIALIVAAIVALAYLIIKYWDEISAFLSKVGQWVYDNVIKPVVDFFVGLWESIKEIFGPAIEFFFSLVSTIWGAVSNIISTIWNNIVIIISNIITIVKGLWDAIISVLKPIATWIWNNVLSPVISFVAGMIDRIWSLVKSVATTVGNVISTVFKSVVNGVLWAIENILNTPIKAINGLVGAINSIPGINLGKLQTFKLPRLAKGTILNNPGKGVPVAGGSAIAGEAGREAYLPLSDEQLLEELGSTIGRHITINLTNINKLNGRVLNRETKKIRNEDEFAYNG